MSISTFQLHVEKVLHFPLPTFQVTVSIKDIKIVWLVFCKLVSAKAKKSAFTLLQSQSGTQLAANIIKIIVSTSSTMNIKRKVTFLQAGQCKCQEGSVAIVEIAKSHQQAKSQEVNVTMVAISKSQTTFHQCDQEQCQTHHPPSIAD